MGHYCTQPWLRCHPIMSHDTPQHKHAKGLPSHSNISGIIFFFFMAAPHSIPSQGNGQATMKTPTGPPKLAISDKPPMENKFLRQNCKKHKKHKKRHKKNIRKKNRETGTSRILCRVASHATLPASQPVTCTNNACLPRPLPLRDTPFPSMRRDPHTHGHGQRGARSFITQIINQHVQEKNLTNTTTNTRIREA